MKKIKLNNKKKTTSLIVIAIILLVSVISLPYILNRNKTDCTLVANQAHKLIQQTKYKEVYTTFEPYAQACLGKADGRVKNKITKNTAKLSAWYDIAVASYALGYKSKADIYAKRGLSISKSLKVEERDKVSGYDSIVYTLLSIELGFYQLPPGVNQ